VRLRRRVQFERINPNVGIDRVGGPDDRGNIHPLTTVRHDDTLHLPLSLHISGPGVFSPGPPPPPAPPAPTELELRALLAAALEATENGSITLGRSQVSGRYRYRPTGREVTESRS
jgi:hypothetical protein